MAANLPVEGDRGPYVGGSLIDVPTCRPEETVEDVGGATGDRVVVVDQSGRALGTVDKERLDAAPPGTKAVDAMKVIPDSIRPSVVLTDLDERAAGMLVTTLDGVLLGAVDPEAVS